MANEISLPIDQRVCQNFGTIDAVMMLKQCSFSFKSTYLKSDLKKVTRSLNGNFNLITDNSDVNEAL